MDDKEYFEKCKKCFEENWAMYEIKKKGWDSCFNLYKGLWYTSTAISHLFNIHIKKELEKKWKKLISLYSVLSEIHHWNWLNIFLLGKNSFAPNYNSDLILEIKNFSRSLLEILWQDLAIEV